MQRISFFLVFSFILLFALQANAVKINSSKFLLNASSENSVYTLFYKHVIFVQMEPEGEWVNLGTRIFEGQSPSFQGGHVLHISAQKPTLVWSLPVFYPQDISNLEWINQKFEVTEREYEPGFEPWDPPLKTTEIATLEFNLLQETKNTIIFRFFDDKQKIKIETTLRWIPIKD